MTQTTSATLTDTPKPHIRIPDEVTLLVPALAKEIGLNESMMFMQLGFWIRTSNNYRNDSWWTYQSVRDIQKKAFPYWSANTINRTIKSLETKGLIVTTDEYNEKKYDRTRWFRFNIENCAKLKAISLMTKDGTAYPVSKSHTLSQNDTHSSQNDTHLGQNDTTIPETPQETPQRNSYAPIGAGIPFIVAFFSQAIGIAVAALQQQQQQQEPAAKETPAPVKQPPKAPIWTKDKLTLIQDIIGRESFNIPQVSETTKTMQSQDVKRLMGRIGPVISFLQSIAPEITEKELMAFYSTYDDENEGAARPRDAGKFGEHFTGWWQRRKIVQMRNERPKRLRPAGQFAGLVGAQANG